LWQLALKSDVSVGSAWIATKLLCLKLNPWIMEKEWGFVIGLSTCAWRTSRS
jgi:hypothetical protein